MRVKGVAGAVVAALVVVGAAGAAEGVVLKEVGQIKGLPGGMGQPSWSPDGKWVAFINEEKETMANGAITVFKRHLALGNVETGEAFRVWSSVQKKDGSWTTKDYVNDPAWSPDGRYIISVGDIQWNTGSPGCLPDENLWLIEVDPKKPGPRPAKSILLGESVAACGQDQFYRRPSWSPDGESVVYEAGEEIRILRVDTGEERAVSDVNSCCPRWSPDGKAIAYIAIPPRPRTNHIAIYNLTTGLTTELNVTAQPIPLLANLEWSPDGKSLLYAGSGIEEKARDIYLVNLATKNTTNLTSGPWIKGDAIWFDSSAVLYAVLDRPSPGNDSSYWLLDIVNATRTRLFNLSGGAPKLSPSGKRLVIPGNGILIYDALEGLSTEAMPSPRTNGFEALLAIASLLILVRIWRRR